MLPAVQRFTFTLAIILSVLYQNGHTAVVNDGLIKLPKAYNPYIILGENYYYINLLQKVNWHRATQTCAFQGMALAQITSNEENNRLRTRKIIENNLNLSGDLASQFWLSANDLATTNEFSWLTDGRPLVYTNWGGNQTYCPVCERHCVRTLPSFEWTVTDCQAEHFFICMQPVAPQCGINGGCKRRP